MIALPLTCNIYKTHANVRSIRPRSSPRVRHRGEKRESAIRFRRER